MHARDCSTKELTRLLVLAKSGEPPGHPDHQIGYEHDVVEICQMCGGATLEKLRHDCFDAEDVWDQYEWYELAPRDGVRLRDLVAKCERPLDHTCACELHRSLRDSARDLPKSSWNTVFDEGQHRHIVTLSSSAVAPRFHLDHSPSSAFPESAVTPRRSSPAELLSVLGLFVLIAGASLTWYYRSTDFTWPIDALVTVGGLALSFLGAVVVVALVHLIGKASQRHAASRQQSRATDGGDAR